MTASGPRRRVSDHVHTEYWEMHEQVRYEQRMSEELKGIRLEVKALSDRVLMLLGAIGILAFAIPLIAPFVRSLFAGV